MRGRVGSASTVSEPAEQPRNLFADASVPVNYQELLVPVVFEPWAEILLAKADVRAGDEVLDVACGTGVVSRRAAIAAGPSGRVTAVDISAPMLEQATSVTGAPDTAEIEYRNGSALNLPFADASFDRVLSQQGLQFFPDKSAALAEMNRVLRPGGTVTLAVWDAGHRLEPFDNYTEALVDAGVEPPFERAFDTAMYVAAPGQVRQLLQDAGFEAIEVTVATTTLEWPEPGLAAAGIMGTPFAPLIQALEAERRRALQADLLRRFGPQEHGEPVRRKSASVIARAG